MYEIKFTELDGRGLYASQDILEGSEIMSCELLVLNEEDTLKVNQTSLEHYTFKFDDTRDCLVLGNAELFNHSDFANCIYTLENFENRKVMKFFASKNIKQGEQLYINYGQDVSVSIDNYVNAKSLTGLGFVKLKIG